MRLFRSLEKVPRKSWITNNTWQCIVFAQKLKKVTRFHIRNSNCNTRRLFFLCWASVHPHVFSHHHAFSSIECARRIAMQSFVTKAFYIHSFASCSIYIRKMIKHDRYTHIEFVCSEAGRAAALGDNKKLTKLTVSPKGFQNSKQCTGSRHHDRCRIL